MMLTKEEIALQIMCACISADKDLPMDHAAQFGIEGMNALCDEIKKQHEREILRQAEDLKEAANAESE